MLNRAIQGSTQTAQRISWPNQTFDDGGTLTGVLIAAGGVERAITGTLVPVSTGLFDWTYSEADVEDTGYFFVQFDWEDAAGTHQKTLRTTWKVEA